MTLASTRSVSSLKLIDMYTNAAPVPEITQYFSSSLYLISIGAASFSFITPLKCLRIGALMKSFLNCDNLLAIPSAISLRCALICSLAALASAYSSSDHCFLIFLVVGKSFTSIANDTSKPGSH